MAEHDDIGPGMADIYDNAAGHAYRDGDFDKALFFISVCRHWDPSRPELWADREFRIKRAETQRYPLPELIARRLGRAGIKSDDPGLQQWICHNQAVFDREVGE